MSHILVVEDETIIRSALRRLLERHHYQVSEAGSVHEAVERFSLDSFDLIVSDLRLPGEPGTELIRKAPNTPVLIMTSYASLRSAVDSMKLGAVDYIAKPFDHDEMLQAVARIIEDASQRRNQPAAELASNEPTSEGSVKSGKELGIIGSCAAMQTLFKRISKVAPTDSTVLIQGESGTGKELVARALHENSKRAKAPLISVNCAAIPETLIESELFGHEKGAFTGAIARRIGKFEEANGGTLLLDEISEMDVRLQAKLLRAIQERVIDRVGGGKPVPVDIRIIATSNRDLAEAVRAGTFREDLLYRLNVVNLKLPPLRERPTDIIELASHFVERYARENGVPRRQISEEARRMLLANPWPGNVRELENTMHRAVLLAMGEEIDVDAIRMPDGSPIARAASPDARLAADVAATAEAISRALVGRTVADVERELILDTLDHCLGNRTHAAKILGISIRTLRNKLNQYADEGVDVPGPGEARIAVA